MNGFLLDLDSILQHLVHFVVLGPLGGSEGGVVSFHLSGSEFGSVLGGSHEVGLGALHGSAVHVFDLGSHIWINAFVLNLINMRLAAFK